MTDQPNRFTENFEAVTRDDWQVLAASALKGIDFEKALVSKTYDSIRIEPVYPRARDAKPLASRSGPWHLVQRMDQPDIEAANSQALTDLENGANGLSIVFPGAPAAYGFGVAINNLDDLDRALKDIYPDIIHLRLETGARDTAAAATFIALCEKRGIDLAKLDVSLGCDPFGAAIFSGTHPNRDEKIPQFADMIEALNKRSFGGRIALADGRVWHAGGASEAQELAGMLAAALAYFRTFEQAGIPLEKAVTQIDFAISSDADQFLSIAKIRALHLLWRRVCESCGIEDAPLHIHAETAWRMMSKRDVYVNMLRATIATFAAGIGGANSLTVLPFTQALGLPDGFARRIARNTQLVLLEESNLAKVGDPATGSGFAETMTRELAEKAWDIFRKIEQQGGLAASLKDGWLQDDVKKVKTEREKNIARRKDPLTGISEFANIAEGNVETLGGEPPWPLETDVSSKLDLPAPGNDEWFEGLVAAAKDGATLAQLSTPGKPGFEIDPLTPARLGESFEKMRDLADTYTQENDQNPKVFLANLGSLASFSARASWIRNIFGAGGIEVLTNDGFADPPSAAAAFKASGARLACICGDDTTYGTLGAAMAKALKEAGADHIFLAGKPGDLRAALEDAGVATFVHAGCDIITILQTAFAALGVTAKGEEK
ncbi:MAG: methylmalonyl-CoA mutase subunit beta [Fimbriimonadaceae bacterium]|nr:methylmalonyl-CoA mutase subunit beta [Alphaproteobacteria bacterium]